MATTADPVAATGAALFWMVLVFLALLAAGLLTTFLVVEAFAIHRNQSVSQSIPEIITIIEKWGWPASQNLESRFASVTEVGQDHYFMWNGGPYLLAH